MDWLTAQRMQACIQADDDRMERVCSRVLPIPYPELAGTFRITSYGNFAIYLHCRQSKRPYYRSFKTSEEARAFMRAFQTACSPLANDPETDTDSSSSSPPPSATDIEEEEAGGQREEGDDEGDEEDEDEDEEEEEDDDELLSSRAKLERVSAQGFMTTADGAVIVYTDASVKNEGNPTARRVAGGGIWWGSAGKAHAW
jgi:hypothetical protein